MGIDDEVGRQNAAMDQAFAGMFDAAELTAAQAAVKPLIDRLEGAREDKYRQHGAFSPTMDGAWTAFFASIWGSNSPRRSEYIQALGDKRASGLFFRIAADEPPQGKHQPASTVLVVDDASYVSTGELSLRYVNGAVYVYAGYLKVSAKHPAQIQERLVGKYHDFESAYEAVLPIYARYIFEADNDIAKTNELHALISAHLQNAPAQMADAARGDPSGKAVGQKARKTAPGQPQTLWGWLLLTLQITISGAAIAISLMWAAQYFELL